MAAPTTASATLTVAAIRCPAAWCTVAVLMALALLPPSALANEADRILGPLELVRPLSPDTLARLDAEAESLYKSRSSAHALAAFSDLVDLDPANARAWLRLGNLKQQSGDVLGAMHAYRQGADAAPQSAGGSGNDGPRAKALLNLALLGLQSTRQAIADLGSLPLDEELQAVRNQVLAQLPAATQRERPDPVMPQPLPVSIQASPRRSRSATEPREPVRPPSSAPELIEGHGGQGPARPRKPRAVVVTEYRSADDAPAEAAASDLQDGRDGK